MDDDRPIGVAIWPDVYDELVEASRQFLRAGSHDGPCLNREGQTASEYDEFDSCYLHLAAFDARLERLRTAVRSLDAV